MFNAFNDDLPRGLKDIKTVASSLVSFTAGPALHDTAREEHMLLIMEDVCVQAPWMQPQSCHTTMDGCKQCA